MTKLLQGYAIGKIKPFSLTPSYFQALKKLCSSVNREVHIFDRLLLDDLNLHTCDYRDGVGKFCNAYCSYKQENGSEMYGEIHMFAECSPVGTVAFIKPLQSTTTSILASSGLPCREILDVYAQHSPISRFIIEINSLINNPIVAIMCN